MTKEQFKDDTYDLNKALIHVSTAKQYFEMIALGYSKGAKDLMNSYAKRMDWVIKDIYDRLPSGVREEYKASLIKGDTVFSSHISNQLLHIDESDKPVVEFIIDNLIKGNKLEVNVVGKQTAY